MASDESLGAETTEPATSAASAAATDLAALEAALRQRIAGEVRFDPGTRAIYAHDASNYRQIPMGVVLPRHTDDVVAAVAVCREHGAPLLMRGAGTSLSGESTNVAVVMDFSKTMHRILEVNAEEGWARVEPGVIRDQLAERTEREHQLTFGPDTSTHQWATLGGMLGNNSCGVHSIMAGRSSDNVEALEVLLYDGTRMSVANHSEQEAAAIIEAGGRRGEIYAQLRDLRDRYAEQIRERYPQIPRRVSGYNLDELLPENGFNVARALIGSESTLVTILEARLRLVHSPPARSLLVLGYPSIYEAGDHVPQVMASGPIGLEGIDDRLIADMRKKNMHPYKIPLLPAGNGWLLVEFGGETQQDSDQQAHALMAQLREDAPAPAMSLFDDPDEAHKLWALREGGLSATAHVPGEGDHWPGWEDAAVPPARVGDYLRDFRVLMDRYGYKAALYGHFGQGCIHCRLNFDLKTAKGLEDWRGFLNEAADLVVSYGGSLSGEHGDGQQRAEFLPKMYGDALMAAFREYKSIWDPAWKMNPGKVIDANSATDNLRFGTDYAPPDPATYFHYDEDGGSFAHAAIERCVGLGRCRNLDGAVMCPSYMATREEKHSTRGRARILGEMVRGEVIKDGFRSNEVMDALDLCLACKGCKSGCPVSVDMATYKAEFLAGYYKRRLRPAKAYSMGLIMYHARLASRWPRFANALLRAPGIGSALKRLGGIARERAMPRFAKDTLRARYARHEPANTQAPRVVLLPDTFNNYFHPEVGSAAIAALEHAGYRVIMPDSFFCCGRPLYDYGMLDRARRFLERAVWSLRPWVRAGTPVVGLEPSCVSTFRDELLRMLPHDQDAKRLAGATHTFGELLINHGDYTPPPLQREVIVHGHCHHESVMNMDAERALYRRMGLDVSMPKTGCCGLAGAFGFERGHYEVSMQIGELRLLPLVRNAGDQALLVADGFSCKLQIEQATQRRALHTAQLIKLALDYGENGPPGQWPERQYPDSEPQARERAPAAASGGGA